MPGRLRSVDRTRPFSLFLLVLLIIPVVAGHADPQTPAPGGSEIPPAEDWLEAAKTGQPLSVRLLGQEQLLLVEANHGLLQDRVRLPEAVNPLKGQIADSPRSHLRVTVIGDTLMGYIEDPVLGRFVLGQDAEGRPRLPSAPLGLPAAPGHDGSGIAVPADDFGCLHPLPLPMGDPIGLADGWPQRMFDLAIAVDTEFVAKHGDDWEGVAIALVNNADGVYFSQIDLSLTIVDLRLNENITGSTTWELLSSLRSHFLTHRGDLERDNVHLFTGKPLDDALGQAMCIGGAGDNDLAYTVSMTAHHDSITINGITLWGDIYTKILVHEIGHILSAHHHYANCVETAPFYQSSRPIDTCTIMMNDPDVLMLKLSMKNKLATRGWVDTRDL